MLIIFAIALLPLALFFPILTGQRVFDNQDLWEYFYPYRQLVVEAARQGRWPLWNPHAFAGIPLLGDGQTAVYFPLNWLAYFIAVPHAVSLAVVLNFSIAALGMFGFCRAIRLSAAPAAIGAIAFGFNGFLAARIGHPSIMAGEAIVPWIFWAAQRVLDGGDFLPLSIAVAFQILTGHPQIPAYTALAVVIYAGMDAVARLSARRLLPLGGAALLGLLLSAAQWMPWVELARFSPRAAGASYEFVTRDAMSGADWLLYFFPYAMGGMRLSPLNSSEAMLVGVMGERMAYAGLFTLMLALWAAWNAIRNVRRIIPFSLLCIAILMLVMSMGDTPIGHVIYWIPILGKLRNMTRAAGVGDFCLCALAAIGAGDLLRRRAAQQTLLSPMICAGIIILPVIAALLIGVFVGRAAHHAWPMFRSISIAQANGYMPLLFALAGAAAMLGLAVRPGRSAAQIAAAVILLDVGATACFYSRESPPVVFGQIPRAAQFLLSQPGVFRSIFVSPRLNTTVTDVAAQQLLGSWAMRFGLDDVNGFDSLQPRRNLDLLESPGREDISYATFVGVDRLAAVNPLAGLFNLGFAIYPADSVLGTPADWPLAYRDEFVRIYKNPRAIDRIHFVDQVIVEGDPEREYATVTNLSFDPARQATVDLGLSAADAAGLSHGGHASAGAVMQSSESIEIRTQSDGARLLVISQNYFPGWRATLDPDGPSPQALPLLRADYAFTGLVVPAGNHLIRFQYRPASVAIGLIVSALAMVIAAGCWMFTGARWARKEAFRA